MCERRERLGGGAGEGLLEAADERAHGLGDQIRIFYRGRVEVYFVAADV